MYRPLTSVRFLNISVPLTYTVRLMLFNRLTWLLPRKSRAPKKRLFVLTSSFTNKQISGDYSNASNGSRYWFLPTPIHLLGNAAMKIYSTTPTFLYPTRWILAALGLCRGSRVDSGTFNWQ